MAGFDSLGRFGSHSLCLLGGTAIHLKSLLRRSRSFRGGLYLPVRRDLAAPPGIRDFPNPPMLCVPMIQHDGPAARIVVQVGQRVQADQLIGRGEKPDSLDVHAPLAGKVVALERIDTARHNDVPAVRIETDPSAAPACDSTPALERSTGETPVPHLFGETPVPHPFGETPAPHPFGETPAPHSFGETPAPHSFGETPAPHNKIHTGGTPVPHNKIHTGETPAPHPFADPLTPEQLAELADRAGLIDFGLSAAPLGRQLRQAATGQLNDLIINALDDEPEPADRSCLLDVSLETVISAAVRLRKTLKARRLWLVVDRYDPHRVRRCRAAAAGKPVRVLALPNKYPQAHPNLLTYAVTGREPPYGSPPMRVSVFVLALEALLALETARVQRRPMTRRLVTVTGDAVRKKGRYLIPFGTPFAHVLQHVDLTRPVTRLIDGSLLTGRAVASVDAVVTRQTTNLLAISRDNDYVANPGPCVRCGRCQDDCPVGLDPQALLDVYERGQIQEALALWPHACLECGLCSHVCPAELPLSEATARLKHLIPLQVQW